MKRTDDYVDVITRTTAMVRDKPVQRLAKKHGLHVLDVTWEDTARKERFEQLGPSAARFFTALTETRRYGKQEAYKILTLLEAYRREDLLAALEHAAQHGAYSSTAAERILAIRATPRTALDRLGRTGTRASTFADERPSHATSRYGRISTSSRRTNVQRNA